MTRSPDALDQTGKPHGALVREFPVFSDRLEVWNDGKLVGGLYGIRLGKIFFGESMFSKESNASKYAFIKYVQQLQAEEVELIDCQVYTEHLESLGGKMIDRKIFAAYLEKLIP